MIISQMEVSESTEDFKKMASSAQGAMIGMTVTNVVMNVVLSSSLQPLWGMINAL
jgi:hypothetical protein